MTYPDGSQLNYEYGATTGDTDDLISRVTTLSLGSGTPTDIVNYDHVGLGMFAEVDYAVPDVQLDRTASHDGKRAIQGFSTQTAGLYPGWDRFGRVVRHTWVDGTTPSTAPPRDTPTGRRSLRPPTPTTAPATASPATTSGLGRKCPTGTSSTSTMTSTGS